jgi:hypothetical protein
MQYRKQIYPSFWRKERRNLEETFIIFRNVNLDYVFFREHKDSNINSAGIMILLEFISII